MIETTSNIPAGYYITAECIEDVQKFAQKMHKKFGDKDGPFSTNEVVIGIFFHDLEHFKINIYHTYFFIVHMNLCIDCTFFTLYSKINMIYEVCF